MAVLGTSLEKVPKARPLVPVGSEQLTVSTSAVALAGVSGAKPTHALIQVTVAPIRWTCWPRTAPTTTLGIRVDANGYIQWLDLGVDYCQLIEKAQFISESGTSAVLEVQYFA